MVDEKQIKQWLKNKTITQKQAKKMLAETAQYKKEERSNKVIIAISTIGAILLGIGAVLFVASNWNAISSLGKVMLLLLSTFGAYFAGYQLKYQKQNLPRVGGSLLFLGALLFGATVILITQIYNINANNHILILIWLIGILPLVYALKSMPIAGLASLLYFLWLGLFFSPTNTWWFMGVLGPVTFVLFIVAAVMLFAIGGLHYIYKELSDVARMYRIAGLKILMVMLFLLTFEWFSRSSYFFDRYAEVPTQVITGVISLAVIAIIITVINWFFNTSKKISKFEGPGSIGMIVLALIFFYYPSSTSIYVIIFNVVLAFMIGILIYMGYHREDMKLVNIGTFWLSAFIVVRYFDWFWNLLPKSIFFLVGGFILVLGGIALEKKRRQLKHQFGTK